MTDVNTADEIAKLRKEVEALKAAIVRLLQWFISLDAGRTKLCEQELEKIK